MLRWTTASEQENDRFEVERSLDGKSWQMIGEEKGHGTTNTLSQYSHADRDITKLNASVVYYRLRQVDFNGQFEYSPIRKLALDARAAIGVKAWYSRASEAMNIMLSADAAGQMQIRLLDAQGKVVLSETFNNAQGTQTMQLNMQGLPNGLYTCMVVSATSVESRKVMKQ
jgi:hypothetical protein